MNFSHIESSIVSRLEQKSRLTESQIAKNSCQVGKISKKLQHEQKLLTEQHATFAAVKEQLLNKDQIQQPLGIAHRWAQTMQAQLRAARRKIDQQSGKVQAIDRERELSIQQLVRLKAVQKVLNDRINSEKIIRHDQRIEWEADQLNELLLTRRVLDERNTINQNQVSSLPEPEIIGIRDLQVQACSAVDTATVSPSLVSPSLVNPSLEGSQQIDAASEKVLAASAAENTNLMNNSQEFSQNFSERLKQQVDKISSWSDASGAGVELEFQAANGRKLAVSFEGSDKLGVSIRVRAGESSDRGVLWAEAEQIRGALRKAGINVSKIEIGKK